MEGDAPYLDPFPSEEEAPYLDPFPFEEEAEEEVEAESYPETFVLATSAYERAFLVPIDAPVSVVLVAFSRLHYS